MRWFIIALFVFSSAIQAGTISIVIDDVGDNERLALRTLYLDKRVALSILPHTPHSRSIAMLAQQRGNDIMLHQPMESHTNNHLLGPGPILTTSSRDELRKTLKQNIKSIPGVIGVNNHMGSKLTESPTQMAWVMSELSQMDLFFMDSRTSAKSIAAKTAKNWSVPSVTRHVFLDHVDSIDAIRVQFNRLVKIAKKHGHAIAIGHPKPNTLEFLEHALASLDDTGVELIAISDYMDFKQYRPIDLPAPEQNCNVLEDLKYHLNTLKQQLVNYRCSPITQSYIVGE